ncbi:uncharacterized protein G2W53_032612 [Senna tora]|uniref:Uncharacterized protein n=1 Tax=Senna tora TaxID=362788 RepID=A0A834SZH3_9FABA|nr:uncharacterized protein G2W53_032612 [Senna tora]
MAFQASYGQSCLEIRTQYGASCTDASATINQY